MGPDAFRKARAPRPFDWEATAPAPPSAASGAAQGRERERSRRRRAFFDMAVDGVAAGRVEFELASDLLPVTCENFLRLCKGVDVGSKQQGLRLRATSGEQVEEEGEEGNLADETMGYEGTAVSEYMFESSLQR